jgi:hypothetical protein
MLNHQVWYLTVYKFGIVIDAFGGLGIRFKQAENTLSKEGNENICTPTSMGLM